MKKTKVFFMALLVTITLLGFCSTSMAFDLSSITQKPIEFVRYIAEKLGFGDDNKKKAPDSETDNKVLADKESTGILPDAQTNSSDSNNPDSNFNSRFVNGRYANSSGEGLTQSYFLNNRQFDNEGINYKFSGEDWHFNVRAATDEIIVPFNLEENNNWPAFESATVPLLLTKMEYQTGLPWGTVPLMNVELYSRSALLRQQSPGINGQLSNNINDTFNLRPEILSFGLNINVPVDKALFGLYFGNETSPLGPAFSFPGELRNSADILWQTLSSGYYARNNNLAAALSYKLPFQSLFHQGDSPTVRLETAYKFGSDNPAYNGLVNNYDQWKMGMSYEETNHINLLNSSFGIDWGIGYNYTVTLNDMNDPDNFGGAYGYHSGNINANAYWNNLRIYTMFMYLYDREDQGSMTVLNATYSPDWRWTYGIKANFYYGRKNQDRAALNNSELVSFTATYRWD